MESPPEERYQLRLLRDLEWQRGRTGEETEEEETWEGRDTEAHLSQGGCTPCGSRAGLGAERPA